MSSVSIASMCAARYQDKCFVDRRRFEAGSLGQVFDCFRKAQEGGGDEKKILENMKKHVFAALVEDVREKGVFSRIFCDCCGVLAFLRNRSIQHQVNAFCDKVFPFLIGSVSKEL